MSDKQSNDPEYIEESDLIQQPTFKSSNKAGYVEESVDQFVDSAITENKKMADRYNQAVYDLSLVRYELEQSKEQNENLAEANQKLMSGKGQISQQDYDGLKEELHETTEKYNELVDNYGATTSRITELEAELAEARREAANASVNTPEQPSANVSEEREPEMVDYYTYDLHAVDGAFIAQVKEFPHLRAVGKNAESALAELMDDVDEQRIELGSAAPKPGEYVEEVSPSAFSQTLDDTKITALFDAASSEAAEHIRRTQDKMIRLESAARAEAESIVAEAHLDAERSREEAARNRAESAEIRSMMINVFESQLSFLKENEGSIGYVPRVNPDGHQLEGDQ